MRRAAADHPVGHRIGLALIRIARPADTPGQAHPAALLHHVRRLVRRQPQVRGRPERHMLTGRESCRVHGSARGR